MSSESLQVLRVAVAVPLRRTFDYLVDPTISLSEQWVGCRVLVSFARRQQVAIVLSVHDSSDVPLAKLKPIEKRIDKLPILNASGLMTGHWLANYYLHPIGEVLFTMLPAALRKGDSAEPEPVEFVVKKYDSLEKLQSTLKSAKKQLALCAELGSGDKPLKQIKKNFSSAVVNELRKKNLIDLIEKKPEQHDSWQSRLDLGKALEANIEQSIAISAINQKTSFATFLIEGVTGSGKTEVYLQVIQNVLKAGKQVLILVPEIGLTPQTVARFEKRFGNVVGVLHSALNDKQRLQVWQQAKANEIGIVIGTRSSIFVPLANPGMIIVDEEHDESFKQQDNVKYHARDIAVYRAQQLDIPLVMGSATPSLESLQNALSKKYHHLQLTQRAANASMPAQLLLDIKGQALKSGLASGLLEKMSQQLAQGNQVLIFVHRRGYSPALLCHECGFVETCLDCDNPFTLHKISHNMQCHRCGEKQAIPRRCKQCGNTDLDTFGLGTEQIEQGLQRLFPAYSCIRIDSDSTRGKGKLSALLSEINDNQHQILIGTQILSKGHHFPNVTLAIILNVDGSLFSSDFRAPEKLGQLITQLSGRAGRANKPGEVWLQTHQAHHPLLQDLVQNGFADYSRTLLMERKQAKLPPFEHQVMLRAESKHIQLAQAFLDYAYSVLTQFEQLKLVGPLPCAIEKKQARFRLMLIVQSASRTYINKALNSAIEVMEAHPNSSKIRWAIDVAPLDFS